MEVEGRGAQQTMREEYERRQETARPALKGLGVPAQDAINVNNSKQLINDRYIIIYGHLCDA